MALTVEKLIGMEVPEKAATIRVLIAELGRIASHLVGMGAYGLDLGTFSPFLYAFREREIILDLFEEVCGARLTYSYITIGGVTHDLPDMIPIPPGWNSAFRNTTPC
jgi:NADH-quinone oxidoreductase subunit D